MHGLNDHLNTRRQSSDSRMLDLAKPYGRHKSRTRSRSPPLQKSRCTLYVKLADSEAYVSLSLRRKTIRHFLDTLSFKCPTFKSYNVISLYQKNAKGLTFLLDDDLMEHVENHQIFDVILEERSDEPEKFNMTLVQVQT